jgi:uncharacterized protein (DUF433 family)
MVALSLSSGSEETTEEESQMAEPTNVPPMVVRTERGLSIAGTRITLYSVMDAILAGWPPKLIRDRFHLTDQQLTAVMDYIAAHRDDVEAEYQEVLQQAEESRRYWEERNKERLAKLASRSGQSRQHALRQKLEAQKAKPHHT